MFDFIARTVSVAVDVATLPVSVAADVVTFGGLATDRDETYTAAKAKRVASELAEAAKILAE